VPELPDLVVYVEQLSALVTGKPLEQVRLGGPFVLRTADPQRASLHVVRGRAALKQFDRGGVEPLEVSLEAFSAALCRENRTLERALTDPRIFRRFPNALRSNAVYTPTGATLSFTGGSVKKRPALKPTVSQVGVEQKVLTELS